MSMFRDFLTGIIFEQRGLHGGISVNPVQAPFATAGAIAIPNAATDLLVLDVSGVNFVSLQIGVTAFALAAFIVQARFNGAGAYQTILTAAGDYTATNVLNRRASGDLNVIAAAGTGWIMLDVRGIESIKLRATSGNVAGSSVTVLGYGQG